MNNFFNKFFNRIIWLLASSILLCGCNSFKACVVQEFMQGRLADGVARLSVAPISLIASELESRFDDPETPKEIIRFSGDEYGRGEVTYTLKDQIIDYPEEKVIIKDCLGNKITWQGKAHVILATMNMKGRLVNEERRPVMPDEDSIQIKVHARVKNLAIQFKGREGYLRLDEGELKFNVHPRLAQSRFGESKGLLAAKTMYARFDKIKLTNVKGTLVSDQLIMPISIEDSLYHLQIGEGKNGESNVIAGQITMFNQQRQIPSDKKGLDPDYNKEDFFKTFKCWKEIDNQPLSFEYDHLEKLISGSMIGLTSLVLGAVAQRLEADENCGMASEAVLLSTKISNRPGKMGYAEDRLRYCDIKFNQYRTEADCFGRAYIINGDVKVIDAQKRISGLVVADTPGYTRLVNNFVLKRDRKPEKPSPIIPGFIQPVIFDIKADLKDVSVHEICLNAGNMAHSLHCLNQNNWQNFDSFNIYEGQAEVKLKPVLAKENDQTSRRVGFCAAETPISQATLTLSKMKASLKAMGKEIHLPLQGQVDLVNGKIGDRENDLRGQINVGKLPILFTNKDVHSKLNVKYDPAAFVDSFSSCQELTIPKSDEECRPERGLAVNIARSLVPVAGAVVKALSPGENVSFRSIRDFRKVTSKEGLNEKMTFAATRNKQGINIKTGELSGTKGLIDRGDIEVEMEGKILGKLDLIKFRRIVGPTKPDSTAVVIQDVAISDLDVAIKDMPLISISSGIISRLEAYPFFRQHESYTRDNRPIFSVETSVSKFKNLSIKNAGIIFRGAGLEIPLNIHSAQIDAFSGRYNGVGNTISGKIIFNTENGLLEVNIPIQELIPKFEKEEYEAIENLDY